MAETKKMFKFPLTFDKCPSCGSAERIANVIGEEEKAKGKITKTAMCVAFLQTIIITDPVKSVLSAPALTTGYDVCAKCGAVYCVFAEVTNAQPHIKGFTGTRN